MRTSLLFLVFVFFFPALPMVQAQTGEGLDSGFGTDGIVLTDIDGTHQSAAVVLPLPDGGVIVVGSTDNTATGPEVHSDYAVVRIDAAGNLDADFGSGGRVKTDFGRDEYDGVLAAALQADGKVIAAGIAHGVSTSDDADFGLARYNTDGSLDPTFGDGGLVVTNIDSYDQAQDIVVQPDGKIIVVGAVGDGPTQIGMARYSADGSLDASFGVDGIAISDAAVDPLPENILLQPDGKFMVVGNDFPNGFIDGELFVARYESDGTLDASFGNAGIVTKSSSTFDRVSDALLQPDGKVLIAGFTREGPSEGNNAVMVLRYLPDGSADTGFGVGGKATLDFGASIVIEAMTLQEDGKIVVGGINIETGYALVRVNQDGTVDSAFATDGMLTVPGRGSLNDIAFQEDGRLLAVGFAENDISSPDFGDIITMRFDLGDVSVANEDPMAFPKSATLASNFPNPFRQRTTLRFSLDVPAHATLSVYDLMGREVARVLDAPRAAGQSEVSFAANELSAGVYIYQLRIDGVPVASRRMVLMR